VLALEWGVDTEGRKHGRERQRDFEGGDSLEFETNYVHGLEHGIAKQYYDGRLVGTYRMDLGTGVDLWRDRNSRLQEERHVRDGALHGFERWWNGDDRTLWKEGHYRGGVEHGIFRDWNDKGRLRRGYPQYYVHGQRVVKRQYLKAAASDQTLPRYREEDNRPERQLPDESVRPE
jgi:hypothetical protein